MADTDNSTITIVMSDSRVITVNFTAPGGLSTVTVEASPTAGGSVTIITPCGSLTSDNVERVVSFQCIAGTEVTLNASPAEGYRFRGWKGDLRDSHDNVTLSVDSSKTITAKFAKPSPFPWGWVVFGAAMFLVSALLVVRLVFPRRRKAENTPASGEPPSQPKPT